MHKNCNRIWLLACEGCNEDAEEGKSEADIIHNGLKSVVTLLAEAMPLIQQTTASAFNPFLIFIPMKTLFLFIIASTFIVSSCSLIKLVKHKNNETLVANHNYEKFEFLKNTIMIHSTFPDGEYNNMALDLGAGSSILLKNSGLKYIESLHPILTFGKTFSADNQKIKNDYYNIGTIKTKSFELCNAFLLVIPDFQVSPCKKIIGIWGADTFDKKILMLRMEDSTLAVFDTMPSLNDWMPVESQYKFPHFYVIFRIGNHKVKLLFDTGYTSGIILSKKDYLRGLHGNNKLIINSSEWTGSFYNTASGLSGTDTTLKAILTKASWGSYSIDSIPITVGNKINKNIVGMEVFKRFNILLDYKHEKLYIQNNPNYKKPKSKNIFVEMGFSIINSKENLISVGVMRIGSPAEKAGLKAGDQIVSVNNIKSDISNNCEVIKLLNALDGSGTNNEVVVIRENELLKFVL